MIDGTLSLNYIGFIGPIVRAIQALSTEVTSFENMIAGFANSFTTKELTFTRAVGNEIDVQKLCVTDSPTDRSPLCVTEAQLAAVLSQSTAAGLANPSPTSGASGFAASSTSDTPPVIQINGENPAILHVGDSYADLGATITGPTADLNLGIRTYLNGAPVNTIQIDTSTVATDTIDYVVNDGNGLTTTSTRTVIVRAADSARAPTEGINPNVGTTSPSASAAATSTAQ